MEKIKPKGETRPKTRPRRPLSHIETLPIELQTQILSSIPDLETLRSAVWASSVLEATYLFNRHEILSECLKRELNGLTIEAYAAVMSRPAPQRKHSTEKHVTEDHDIENCGSGNNTRDAFRMVMIFLDDYGNWASDRKKFPDIKA